MDCEAYPDEMFIAAEKAHKQLTHEEMLEIAAERERPFYRFFAIDYLATGEGRSFWLKICRNYQRVDDKDREYEKFKEFVDCDYYMECFEELTEEEFMKRYDTLVPHNVKMMLHRRDQPAFTWETHYHFNYS
jgi:hypothetical protein